MSGYVQRLSVCAFEMLQADFRENSWGIYMGPDILYIRAVLSAKTASWRHELPAMLGTTF